MGWKRPYRNHKSAPQQTFLHCGMTCPVAVITCARNGQSLRPFASGGASPQVARRLRWPLASGGSGAQSHADPLVALVDEDDARLAQGVDQPRG